MEKRRDKMASKMGQKASVGGSRANHANSGDREAIEQQLAAILRFDHARKGFEEQMVQMDLTPHARGSAEQHLAAMVEEAQEVIQTLFPAAARAVLERQAEIDALEEAMSYLDMYAQWLPDGDLGTKVDAMLERIYAEVPPADSDYWEEVIEEASELWYEYSRYPEVVEYADGFDLESAITHNVNARRREC